MPVLILRSQARPEFGLVGTPDQLATDRAYLRDQPAPALDLMEAFGAVDAWGASEADTLAERFAAARSIPLCPFLHAVKFTPELLGLLEGRTRPMTGAECRAAGVKGPGRHGPRAKPTVSAGLSGRLARRRAKV